MTYMKKSGKIIGLAAALSLSFTAAAGLPVFADTADYDSGYTDDYADYYQEEDAQAYYAEDAQAEEYAEFYAEDAQTEEYDAYYGAEDAAGTLADPSENWQIEAWTYLEDADTYDITYSTEFEPIQAGAEDLDGYFGTELYLYGFVPGSYQVSFSIGSDAEDALSEDIKQVSFDILEDSEYYEGKILRVSLGDEIPEEVSAVPGVYHITAVVEYYDDAAMQTWTKEYAPFRSNADLKNSFEIPEGFEKCMEDEKCIADEEDEIIASYQPFIPEEDRIVKKTEQMDFWYRPTMDGSESSYPAEPQGQTPADAQTPDNQGQTPADTQTPDNQGQTPANTQTPDNQSQTPADTQTPDNQGQTPADTQTPDNQGQTQADTQTPADQQTPESGSPSQSNESAPASSSPSGYDPSEVTPSAPTQVIYQGDTVGPAAYGDESSAGPGGMSAGSIRSSATGPSLSSNQGSTSPTTGPNSNNTPAATSPTGPGTTSPVSGTTPFSNGSAMGSLGLPGANPSGTNSQLSPGAGNTNTNTSGSPLTPGSSSGSPNTAGSSKPGTVSPAGSQSTPSQQAAVPGGNPPQTDDNSQGMLFVMLAAASACLLGAALWLLFRKNREY